MKPSKVNSKGQITIPAAIRRFLEIKMNTKIYASVENGKIVLQPINKKYFISLIGIGNTKGKAMKSLLSEKKEE